MSLRCTTHMLAEVHHTRPVVKQDHAATGQERAEMLRERPQTQYGFAESCEANATKLHMLGKTPHGRAHRRCVRVTD